MPFRFCAPAPAYPGGDGTQGRCQEASWTPHSHNRTRKSLVVLRKHREWVQSEKFRWASTSTIALAFSMSCTSRYGPMLSNWLRRTPLSLGSRYNAGRPAGTRYVLHYLLICGLTNVTLHCLETKFHVKPLPHARIPIVKLSLDPSPGLPLGIACDIGFENRLALENTRLLMCYAMIDPTRVRTMVLFRE